MNTLTNFFGKRGITLIVLSAVILVAGLNVTRVAAQASIPGDALYSVKTLIEQSRLSLARDAGERASMKLIFAEERLKEISALIEEGRFFEIGSTVLAFEEDINAAIIELETLAEIDPAKASEIAAEIASALTKYAQELSRLLSGVPESVRAEILRAIDSAELAEGIQLPGFGQSIDDNANDNGNDNGNDANDNGDDNGNDINDNGDDNGNDANDNGDDNGNDANDNDDDNGNDVNDNGDDNGNDVNDNDDDNGNDVNDNDDDNGNESGGGSGSGGGGSSGSGGGDNRDD